MLNRVKNSLDRWDSAKQMPGLSELGKGASAALDIAAPFVNTLSNAVDITVSHLPGLGLLNRPLKAYASTFQEVEKTEAEYTAADKEAIAKGLKAEMKRRGWDEKNYRELVKGLGQHTAGMVPVFLGGLLRSMGMLVGGYDDDENERGKQNFRTAAGAKPMSLLIGGRRWRLDMLPIGPMMAMGADAYDAVTGKRTGLGMTKGVLKAMYSRVEDNPMFQAIGELKDLVVDTQRHGIEQAVPTYLGKKAASFVPAGIGTFTQQIDPYRRDTRNREHDFQGGMNIIQSKIPGWASKLPKKQNVMGQIEKRDLFSTSFPFGGTPGRDEIGGTEEERAVYKEGLRIQGGVQYPRQGPEETDEEYQERAAEIVSDGIHQ